MRGLSLAVLVLVATACLAGADDARVYWDRYHGNAVQTGNVIFYQDGTTGYRHGDTVTYSDGHVGTRIGNTTFNSDGTQSYRAGVVTMHSDGGYSVRNGRYLFNSDGSVIWLAPGPGRQSIIVHPPPVR